MAKLDRLVWADGMSFTAYGVHVGLRVNDKALLKQLIPRLPPGARPSQVRTTNHLYSMTGFVNESKGRVTRLNLGYWNLFRFARTRSFDDLLEQFESHLQLTVAEYAPGRVFVHAGVVGWKGKAILIPGSSFSGKSSLVAELLRAGATYYSDEYAVIDASGRVHPYPRELRIRSTESVWPKRIKATEFGSQIGAKPLPVGVVVSTRFQDGAHFRPRKLSPGKTVLELLANTVSARSQPEMALSYLTKSVTPATAFKGVRGEATDIVDWLSRIV
ncbi:MAG TPA: hypothetical protein VHP99_11525 [Pyrinomonadaceae bacterium]|jgi:hypothetical protein|nr:hypothetical protein [Pyrinomonadaceae bacterium]